MTSSISPRPSSGTFRRRSLMQWAARSSGRVRLNDPRNDFARGVRELATTTASFMSVLLKGNPSKAVDPLFGFARCPDEDKFLDGDGKGSRFTEQNNAGAIGCGGELRKVCWHRTSVLTDKDSSLFGGQSQDFCVF